MNSFQLKYHKCRVLVAALIGIPLIGALLMLVILFCLPIDTPVWAISILIIFFLALMILALKWVIKTQIFVACDVELNKNGIKFEIKHNTLFYSKKSFHFGWNNIRSIEEKFSNQNGDYYYAVKFSEPSFSANFSIKEQHEAEAEAFFKQLRQFQESQNQSESHFPKHYKINGNNMWATN